MCSQRATIMVCRFQNAVRATPAAPARPGSASIDLISTDHLVVVDRHSTQFDIGRQLRLRGLSVDVQLVAHQAVAAMLAGGFDQYGITRGLDRLARIVLAVP